MHKLQLIEEFRKQTDLSKTDSAKIVDLFFNKMAATLAKGDRVEIRGLCSFYVKKTHVLGRFIKLLKCMFDPLWC